MRKARLASLITSENSDGSMLAFERFVLRSAGGSPATIRRNPGLPGTLVRTIAPLLSTAPKISARAALADAMPSAAQATSIAFTGRDEGRQRMFVFPLHLNCGAEKNAFAMGHLPTL